MRLGFLEIISTPCTRAFEGKVMNILQDTFQEVDFEDYCVSEFCPSGTVIIFGCPERGDGLLPTRAVLICILSLLSQLCHYSTFYSLKFIEEADNFAFQIELITTLSVSTYPKHSPSFQVVRGTAFASVRLVMCISPSIAAKRRQLWPILI